jgi:hypothetical protein
MDVARLHSLAEEIGADEGNKALSRLLQALEDAYSSSVRLPTSDTAHAYEDALAAFMRAARDARAVTMTPAKLAMLEELHAADLIGNGLIERVEQILSTGVSPATIVDNLRTLATRMTKLHATLDMLRVSLDDLRVTRAGPAGEDAHVEVRLPAGAYDGSLGGLARESEELNDALFVIVEAATGVRSLLTVGVVSTSPSAIVVSLDLSSASLLLSVAVQLLVILRDRLALKHTRTDLERQHAPERIQSDLAVWHQQQEDGAVVQLRDEVLSAVPEVERRAELAAPAERALRYLADRFQAGMRISVDTGSADDDVQADLHAQIADLQQRALELANEISNPPSRSLSYSYPPRLRLARRKPSRVSLPPMVR